MNDGTRKSLVACWDNYKKSCFPKGFNSKSEEDYFQAVFCAGMFEMFDLLDMTARKNPCDIEASKAIFRIAQEMGEIAIVQSSKAMSSKPPILNILTLN